MFTTTMKKSSRVEHANLSLNKELRSKYLKQLIKLVKKPIQIVALSYTFNQYKYKTNGIEDFPWACSGVFSSTTHPSFKKQSMKL